MPRMDAKGEVSRKHFHQAMFFLEGMKTIIILLLGLVLWFFLTEYKVEWAKLKPFCFAKENMNFWFEIRFYPDRDLLVKVLTSSASFNARKKILPLFSIQQGSQDSSHLPCHFSNAPNTTTIYF